MESKYFLPAILNGGGIPEFGKESQLADLSCSSEVTNGGTSFKVRVFFSDHNIYLVFPDSSAVKLPLKHILSINDEKQKLFTRQIIVRYPGEDFYFMGLKKKESASIYDKIFDICFKREVKPWQKAEREARKGTIDKGLFRMIEDSREGVRELVKKTLEQAGDLDLLVENAKQIKYVLDSARKKIADKAKESGEGEEDEDLIKANAFVQEIGLVNVTTKAQLADSDRFYTALGHEIFSTLNSYIRSNGGCVDAAVCYGILNKARGVMIVSPKDFILGCEKMKALGLGLELATIKTEIKDRNIRVLQVAGGFEKLCFENLQKLFDQKSGKYPRVKVSDVAKDLKISGQLALYILEKAEKSLILCRDVSPAGLVFYKNFFGDFTDGAK
ncbi:putative multi-domain containing protein [Aduncisulcus paluster]|uniref:Vacuolar protein-sorting-associated protein 36 n=1 Tax=Aduncisulcus paluster TaxID=2918883 RepID=A0ABQ5K542_9EUKA|nr:putative multi-domain containing protein [Aduncisulcus paluster]